MKNNYTDFINNLTDFHTAVVAGFDPYFKDLDRVLCIKFC